MAALQLRCGSKSVEDSEKKKRKRERHHYHISVNQSISNQKRQVERKSDLHSQIRFTPRMDTQLKVETEQKKKTKEFSISIEPNLKTKK